MAQSSSANHRVSLSAEVTALKGVGPDVARRLQRVGVTRIEDLLFLLPLRYEDRTKILPLGGLVPGMHALVEGDVEIADVVFRRRRMLLCQIADGTGQLTLRFFHFSGAQQRGLVRGSRLRCYGEVRGGPKGLEMVHPEYRRVSADTAGPEETLTPVYPTLEGLGQQRIRGLVAQALARIEAAPLVDSLAGKLTDTPGLQESVVGLHHPPASVSADAFTSGQHPWQRRLALEELVAHRLSLLSLRHEQQQARAVAIGQSQAATDFVESLPFKLTNAQQRVLSEIMADLARPLPMLRLVQGDVGSGKTVVAAGVAANAAAAGVQTAVMAPTELLAEQHFHNFDSWLTPLGIRVAWLTGSVTGAARRAVLAEIASGDALVVVGTHALFQEGVEFRDLALVVVDEQHRFGVQQRLRLQQKGEAGGREPHQLTMTATPIPRTLTMTAYADLDCSVIDELPPGRQPVQTVVLPESRRVKLVQRVESLCATGAQVYWVCPLIEESEHIESQAAEDVHQKLSEALSELKIGLVHGRMRGPEKERVMQRFKAGDLDVLVATTVIEVGVDVPNARLMVIENAERMGLSQLHQLRGRVGRGAGESRCIMLYRSPLSDLARHRLAVLRDTQDGFVVAQRDLELRGPGEVLGTKQTGLMQLRIADLIRDADLLSEVTRLSDELLATQPDQIELLASRWLVGGEEYGKV
jgi:ATP-dependent DNA helicase RecG